MGLVNSKHFGNGDDIKQFVGSNENKLDEIKQIEEWTGLIIGNIIFDSDIDNWNINTSSLIDKIINKSNLIFLIEDEECNLFGGYINAIISKVDYFIEDPKAFVFSLKSNGRLNGMLKFDIIDPVYAFWLDTQTTDWLFSFGGGYDICIYAAGVKNKSYCKQYSFNYYGSENVFCGRTYPNTFKPTRVIVIQMH